MEHLTVSKPFPGHLPVPPGGETLTWRLTNELKHVCSFLTLRQLPNGANGEQRFGVIEVKTYPEHQGNGYARMLWQKASEWGTIYHSPPSRLTNEGRRFAAALGGPTLTEAEADEFLPKLDAYARLSGVTIRNADN